MQVYATLQRRKSTSRMGRDMESCDSPPCALRLAACFHLMYSVLLRQRVICYSGMQGCTRSMQQLPPDTGSKPRACKRLLRKCSQICTCRSISDRGRGQAAATSMVQDPGTSLAAHQCFLVDAAEVEHHRLVAIARGEPVAVNMDAPNKQ
jgi:hypothetical protein